MPTPPPPPLPPPAASPKPKPPSNEPNPDSRGAIATINRWFHEGLLAIIAGFGRLSISLSSAPPSHPPGTPPSLSVLRIVDLFRDVFVEFFKIYQIIHPFKYFFQEIIHNLLISVFSPLYSGFAVPPNCDLAKLTIM
jgi:hypothetical protein